MQRQSWLLWVDGSWRLLLPVEPRPQDWLRLRPHRAGDGPHQHEGRLAAGGRRQGGRPAGQRLHLLPHLVAPRVKKGSLAVVDLILSFKAIEMLTTSCLRSSRPPGFAFENFLTIYIYDQITHQPMNIKVTSTSKNTQR